MRVFVDTSTLFKKYVDEHGSLEFDRILDEASELIVSPLTRIEMHSALAKCVREKILSRDQAEKLKAEIKKDFSFYSCVYWNESLEEKSVEIVQKFTLKTLDAVQLAAGILSKADMFVTSDKRLFDEARRVIKKIYFA